jgi:RNA polymerase sigma-70 factor, ECF subfamily
MPSVDAPTAFRQQLLGTIPRLRRYARSLVFDASWVDGEAVIDALPAVGNDLGLRLDLLAALAKLPIEQRQPLLLVTLEQLTYAECADVLRIPVGTVMSRISRARTALRDLLDGRSPANARGLRRVV